MGFMLEAAGLGLAGLDPTGALIAIAALIGGARGRYVVVFGLVGLLGTVAFGTALALELGPRIARVDWSKYAPEERTVAFVGVVLGLGLLVWGAVSILRRDKAAPESKPLLLRMIRITGPVSMAGIGVLYAFAATSDPAFDSLVVIAGRDKPVWAVIAAFFIWTLVSRSPLVLVTVVAARGRHERAVELFRSWWARIRPLIALAAAGAAVLAGAFLLLDAGWWFATGDFLVPGLTRPIVG